MRLLCVLLAVLFSLRLTAQVTLSDEAEIFVITCGPDVNELYSAFGHSAFRVRDPQLGIDYAFNYGVFDFDQPNFYLNFARGRNFYLLAAYDYQRFESSYRNANRFIHAQKLNLNRVQRQKVFNYLVWNAHPDNRTYRYDYYHDNCASRIRDVLHSQLSPDITWDSTFLTGRHSFREKTNEYLGTLPWGDLGIDVCLGSPIDRKMTAWEYMFLPDYVEMFVGHARIRGDSLEMPLAAETQIVFEGKPQQAWVAFVHPWVAFGALLVVALALSAWDWQRKKLSRWFDVFLFGATGLIGLLLLVLWLFTDHHDAAMNFNLVWAMPLHVLGAALLLRKPGSVVKHYFRVVGLLSVLLLAAWPFLPQQLNIFLVPLVIALAIRGLIVSWRVAQNNRTAAAQ
jgi:uncharacterized membrane protein YqjE